MQLLSFPVEAMAAGLPLIVTRSGGIEEYTSPECAVIVDAMVNSGISFRELSSLCNAILIDATKCLKLV